MEGIGIALFIIMIVISLIDQASKAGRQGKPGERPQRPLPGRRPGAELPGARGRREDALPGGARPGAEPVLGSGRETGASRSAADMIPEDFWRELTGQPPRPRPAPPPQPAPVEGSSSEEAIVKRVEAPPPETAPRRVSTSWDYRRPEVVHEAPVVVSLEAPLPAPDVRHTAYHKRLAAQDAAVAQTATLAQAAAAQAASAASSPLLRRLRRGEGLRESVIMAEVFGPPRGLEEHSPDR